MEPYHMLLLRARLDLGAMAMKGYTAFPKTLTLLKPHYHIVLYHIGDNCRRSLTPPQICIQCILLPQPGGPCCIYVPPEYLFHWFGNSLRFYKVFYCH